MGREGKGTVESETSTVERVREGDTSAFGVLVERYQDAVFAVALTKTGSFADAQDIAQDTFLSAFQALDTLRDPARFGPWLYTIARNQLRMHLRAKQRRGAQVEADAQVDTRSGPDKAASRRELRDAVMVALQRLSEIQRETATLFYINGYSVDDISRFTDRPTGTVKRRLHDARQNLRKELVDMVEQGLKQSRPDKAFTDRVLRRIPYVRTCIHHQQNGLLLTDARQRSFLVMVGGTEAASIEPWLNGKGCADDLDMHTTIVRTLGQFDWRVSGLTITEIRESTFYALLELERESETIELDCRPSDGLNLAVRAEAAIYADKQVAQQANVKGGKALAHESASKVFQAAGMPASGLSQLGEALRALQKDRTQEEPRGNVARALATTSTTHADKAIAVIEKWARQAEGKPYEAFAWACVGSAYLLPPTIRAGHAIPHLEKSRALDKNDGDVVFTLVTAYALVGRKTDALALLEKRPQSHAAAKTFLNVKSLWSLPRFRRNIGAPTRERESYFLLPVFRHSIGWAPSGAEQLAAHSTQFDPIDLRAAGEKQGERLGKRLNGHRLLSAKALWRAIGPGKSAGRFVLELKKRCAVPVSVDPTAPWFGDFSLGRERMQRPMTPDTFQNALRAVGLKLDAVVLVRAGRGKKVKAVLMLSEGRHHETVAIDVPPAISLACTCKRPILVTEDLAEKLCVRGKNNRPLSPRGAIRKLTGKR